MQNLVIVESPTKARTLGKFLGGKYQVEASMGHIRDLPKSELGVDIEHHFTPRYIIPRDKLKKVNELKKAAASAKNLWLATDPDREGEAIAWHLQELVAGGGLGADKKKTREPRAKSQLPTIRRVEFHEITEGAIKEAFEHPRDIDLQLVDAQQGRRVLDRVVGYKLSPLLWKKVKSGLSAGRVQSVALRLIVEREREVQAFNPIEFWSVEANLEAAERKNANFVATLIEQDGKKVEIPNGEVAGEITKQLQAATYKVSSVNTREVRKYPAPPFTTSTIQQTASSRLGFSAKKTMMVAQTLYERGLITYMRTDSVNLSTQAVGAIRNYIEQQVGKAYLPGSPRFYKTKSKVAQEAHEAVRPTDIRLGSEQLKMMDGMTRDHVRLYELIWKRALACQMSEAVLNQTTVDVKAENNGSKFLLRASGSVIKFDGWLKAYGKGADEEEKDEKGQHLPVLNTDDRLSLLQLMPVQHFTEPPPRYNEASLIKKLEELGIGRPSTYAPIISTIQDRYYVEKMEKKFIPTPLGIAVTDFLLQYFPDIVDYDFTARMEDELDEIARGERRWQPTIEEFYTPFEKKLNEVSENAEKMQIASEVTDKVCPKCGKNLQVKYGKFGKFLACTGFPECKYTESIEEKVNARCPDCGGEIVVRRTKKGRPFYGCKNWPKCKYASWTKPKKVNSEQTTVNSDKR